MGFHAGFTSVENEQISPYWRSVTSTCAVLKVAERWSRSWTGAQCVDASVFIRSQLYSSVTLKETCEYLRLSRAKC